ncbi:MAG: 2-amino-4-hydroxy-6-hydroxymethyldihydropteridine diphosphokinase [Gammaproteobacteria bacterium]|nr:MAG: 2-amino-4-hydroxy-6-hydroxymethyldihydropteridine diphosphokinase [Gammaproteobacteria bacterium]
MRWRPAYVGLGSNLDDPERQVVDGFARLVALPGSRLVLRSGLWSSAPLGPPDQPDFVNAVAGLLTALEPLALLGELRAIERAQGKVEPSIRWGPRRIDLDLLLLGELCCDSGGLQLPHPGLHQRNFVLYPLAEIAPELWVPGHGRVRMLLGQVGGDGVRPLGKWGSGERSKAQ